MAARKAAIQAYNAQHRYRKRGLCAIPTKFGINFTAKFMNQGGALVHVYQDGTVLVSHGGTEMGQGLHTKVRCVRGGCMHAGRQAGRHAVSLPSDPIRFRGIKITHTRTLISAPLRQQAQVIQVAARAFGISDEHVHIAETATDKARYNMNEWMDA